MHKRFVPELSWILLVPFLLLSIPGKHMMIQKDHLSHPAECSSAEDGYSLVWSDEFNKEGRPDSTNWNYENGFVRNNELQWYQPQNAWCENGNLVIEARREQRENPMYDPGSEDWKKQRPYIHYTSACLITAGKRTWQYGRFEMRGRIDISEGMWPAWWTLGVEKAWPANGEIDIMEYYKNKLLANIALQGKDHSTEWFSTTRNVDSMGGSSWSKQFHIWRMDWDENGISLYVDGTLLNNVSMSSLVNKDDTNFYPFRQPHYMLFNLALGGTNGGTPDLTSFPRRFEIDYVRVYQKAGSGRRLE